MRLAWNATFLANCSEGSKVNTFFVALCKWDKQFYESIVVSYWLQDVYLKFHCASHLFTVSWTYFPAGILLQFLWQKYLWLRFLASFILLSCVLNLSKTFYTDNHCFFDTIWHKTLKYQIIQIEIIQICIVVAKIFNVYRGNSSGNKLFERIINMAALKLFSSCQS